MTLNHMYTDERDTNLIQMDYSEDSAELAEQTQQRPLVTIEVQ